MKKLIALTLALCLIMSMAACNKTAGNAEPDPTATATVETSENTEKTDAEIKTVGTYYLNEVAGLPVSMAAGYLKISEDDLKHSIYLELKEDGVAELGVTAEDQLQISNAKWSVEGTTLTLEFPEQTSAAITGEIANGFIYLTIDDQNVILAQDAAVENGSPNMGFVSDLPDEEVESEATESVEPTEAETDAEAEETDADAEEASAEATKDASAKKVAG